MKWMARSSVPFLVSVELEATSWKVSNQHNASAVPVPELQLALSVLSINAMPHAVSINAPPHHLVRSSTHDSAPVPSRSRPRLGPTSQKKHVVPHESLWSCTHMDDSEIIEILRSSQVERCHGCWKAVTGHFSTLAARGGSQTKLTKLVSSARLMVVSWNSGAKRCDTTTFAEHSAGPFHIVAPQEAALTSTRADLPANSTWCPTRK